MLSTMNLVWIRTLKHDRAGLTIDNKMLKSLMLLDCDQLIYFFFQLLIGTILFRKSSSFTIQVQINSQIQNLDNIRDNN